MSAAVASMYIRCKRRKVTVFLQVEPTDTVLEVKAKLQALLDQVRGTEGSPRPHTRALE